MINNLPFDYLFSCRSFFKHVYQTKTITISLCNLSYQWQTSSSGSISFVIYRLLSALSVTTIAVLSINQHLNYFHRSIGHYFIYLTHWGLLLCLLYVWLGLALAIRYSSTKQLNDEMPLILKVYWSLHNTSLVLSLLITSMYWIGLNETALANGINPLDPVNLLTHGGITILMLIDLFVVAHPIRLMHFIQLIVLEIVYGMFTCIYYFADGIDV